MLKLLLLVVLCGFCLLRDEWLCVQHSPHFLPSIYGLFPLFFSVDQLQSVKMKSKLISEQNIGTFSTANVSATKDKTSGAGTLTFVCVCVCVSAVSVQDPLAECAGCQEEDSAQKALCG